MERYLWETPIAQAISSVFMLGRIKYEDDCVGTQNLPAARDVLKRRLEMMNAKE